MWSFFTCVREIWTSAKARKNLEIVEIWLNRRNFCISRSFLQTNDLVLQRIAQDRKLLCFVEQRQLKFLGHVVRKEELQDLSLSGIPGEVRVLRQLLDSACHCRIIKNIGIGNNWKQLIVYQGLNHPCIQTREKQRK